MVEQIDSLLAAEQTQQSTRVLATLVSAGAMDIKIAIGYDRPPARDFNEVAELYIGRMLVTAAAKYALPPAFQTSRYAVGSVSNLPLYLGIRGWGYLIEDDPVVVPASDKGADRSFEGWILQFVESAPEHLPALAAANIYCEADYLSFENSLSANLRQQIGMFRVRVLVEDLSDPCAIAIAAPPWLSVRAFETMNLTVRVSSWARSLRC